MRHDDVLWMGLTVWYMAVLALCATAAPGEGLFGALLLLIPSSLHTWLYIPAAGLLAWLLLHSLESRQWSARSAVVMSACLALAFAGGLEWAQAWQGGRAPVLAHLGWAGVGILLTWMLWSLGSRHTVRPVQLAEVLPFRMVAGRRRKGSLQ